VKDADNQKQVRHNISSDVLMQQLPTPQRPVEKQDAANGHDVPSDRLQLDYKQVHSLHNDMKECRQAVSLVGWIQYNTELLRGMASLLYHHCSTAHFPSH